LLTRLQRRGVFINRAFPVHAEPEYWHDKASQSA
jgi:hypothetical protein